ncbi:MAG: histidine triad nucleotide-binding protein [Planctomycetota bacterium]
MSDDCLFCKIINKKLPAAVVAESENCIAIEDKFPQAPVHCLVIPKRHIVSLHTAADSDAALLGEMLILSKKCADAKGVGEGGYRVLTNIGADGGQAVFHIHFHILGGKRLGAKLVQP